MIFLFLCHGETGWRHYFTAGLLQKIAGQNPELRGVWRGYDEQLNPLPEPPVNEATKKVMLETIASHPGLKFGYAEEATTSYQTFRKLKQEGLVAENVRFQVCLPGLGSWTMFVLPEYQSAMEQLAFRALHKDVVRIAEELPGADIAMQFDIAADFILMEAQKNTTYLYTLRVDFHPRSEDLKEIYSNQYVELISLVAPAATIIEDAASVLRIISETSRGASLEEMPTKAEVTDRWSMAMA